MKCASIDIGTNTLRLLVAELTKEGTLEPKLVRRFITRLGGGFTEEKGIDGASAERAFTVLGEIRLILEKEAPDFVDAVATSAVRSARNRDWFIEEGTKRLGSAIKVIDGELEARLSLLGVASVLDEDIDTGKKRLVMDIGGGSTEFVFARGDYVEAAISLDLGVVHLTEEFLKSDPPDKAELGKLIKEIVGAIHKLKRLAKEESVDPKEYSPDAEGTVFIGTAGTVTTLSALNMELTDYDPDIINGSKLTRVEVRRLYENLIKFTMEERLQDAALEKGREDLIVPGALIVLMAMVAFGFKEMTVSDAGLLEGIILESHR